jgi:ADP-heptose:LPS heptosyltransferase
MKILFITATRVGDAVLSTGLLSHLITLHPTARITIVCGPAAAGLFEAVPGLDKIIALPKKRWSLHWLDMWRACVGTIWDVVIDLRNAPISYALVAKKTYHLGRAHMNDHRVVRNGGLLGMASMPPSPQLWCNDQQQKRAEEIIPKDSNVIAIAPVANWKPKSWPAQNFIELMGRLTGDQGIFPGAKIMIFGTDSERVQAAELLDKIPQGQLIDCMGTLSLLEIYACLGKCDFFVGNDSGLMHMAAAAGVPTLGLFGPSRENHYAPWGEKAMPVRGDLGYDEIFPKDYDYRNSNHYELMSGLSVDTVEQAAHKLWKKSST